MMAGAFAQTFANVLKLTDLPFYQVLDFYRNVFKREKN